MLDLNMEGTHGLNVLVELRKLDAQARIVVASADSQHSTRATVKAGGACAMIAKPLAADRVINTVNTVLGGGTTWS
jgi:DNA-binding NarL/FixJ family response regulator